MINNNDKASYEDLKSENELLKSELDNIKKSKENKTKVAKLIGKKGVEVFIGQGLKNTLKRTLNEFNKDKKVSTDTLAELGAHAFWRFTRIGLFGLLVAILPTIFLIIQTFYLGKQNKKIDKQNELIDNQNIRLEQQTYLQEASRRGSLVFLLNDVMNGIDSELSEESNTTRDLSDELIGRIISLSRSLKPYRYLENDSLTVLSSPERGQLLISLINAKLDRRSYLRIFDQGDFSYSEISNYEFHGIEFASINLNNAILNNVTFDRCIFENPQLENIFSKQLTLTDCYITAMNFRKSVIENLEYNGHRGISLKISFSESIVRKLNVKYSDIELMSFLNCFIQDFSINSSSFCRLKIINESLNLPMLFKKNKLQDLNSEKSQKAEVDYQELNFDYKFKEVTIRELEISNNIALKVVGIKRRTKIGITVVNSKIGKEKPLFLKSKNYLIKEENEKSVFIDLDIMNSKMIKEPGEAAKKYKNDKRLFFPNPVKVDCYDRLMEIYELN